MKLLVLLCVIACSVYGCDNLFEEPTAATLSSGGDASSLKYLVGVEMASSSTDAAKTASLRIHRDGTGNPTCVDVHGFGNNIISVPLEKRGEGEWKIDNAIHGTYGRYQKVSTSAANLAITLHWTKKRSSISADNLRDNPTGRLEYLSASLNDGTQYEYQNDEDNKSGIAIGSSSTAPTDYVFIGTTCHRGGGTSGG